MTKGRCNIQQTRAIQAAMFYSKYLTKQAWLHVTFPVPFLGGSWLEWILQNQVSARKLELNKIIFRQMATTLRLALRLSFRF